MRPIAGLASFLLATYVVAELLSLAGEATGNVTGGSLPLVTIGKTVISANVLGLISLVTGVGLCTLALFGRRKVKAIRGWIILLALLVTFLVIHSAARVSGGEMTMPSTFQLGGMAIAFFGFWLGFGGNQGETEMQSYIIFAALTILYWMMDLSAMPIVIGSGAPSTVFAGGGIFDSDFVWPFSATLAYNVAIRVVRRSVWA